MYVKYKFILEVLLYAGIYQSNINIDLPQKAKALAENQQSISLGEVLQSHWLPLLFDHT